jgi:hypothetical protein
MLQVTAAVTNRFQVGQVLSRYYVKMNIFEYIHWVSILLIIKCWSLIHTTNSTTTKGFTSEKSVETHSPSRVPDFAHGVLVRLTHYFSVLPPHFRPGVDDIILYHENPLVEVLSTVHFPHVL